MTTHTRRSLPYLPVAERLALARLPARIEHLSKSDARPGQKKAFNWLERVIADSGPMHPELEVRPEFQGLRVESKKNLVIHGSREIGKTTVAVAMLREALQQHRVSGHFVRADDLFDMFADSERNGGLLPSTYSDPMQLGLIKRHFDIVVVDDLGAERLTDFRQEAFREFVVRRHSEGMPVIFTTRLEAADLTGRYDARTIEYLTHKANADWVGQAPRGKVRGR